MKRRPIQLLAGLVVFLLVSCASQTSTEKQDSARPVTTEESQLLAIARFNNFDAGSRPFITTVQDRGVDLRLQGWVDYVGHLGYASTTGEFAPQAMIWTPSTVGIIEREPDSTGNPVLPIPSNDDPTLTTAALDASMSRLDALLSVISSLGADRPDNPLLLQQSGALWLRNDEVGGIPVTVFAAPPNDSPRDKTSPKLNEDTSPLRLWVDENGLLLRAEARLGGDWSVIDFSDEPGPELALPAASQP